MQSIRVLRAQNDPCIFTNTVLSKVGRDIVC